MPIAAAATCTSHWETDMTSTPQSPRGLQHCDTLIRHALAHGEDARFLLPAVLDYIQNHHLYSR